MKTLSKTSLAATLLVTAAPTLALAGGRYHDRGGSGRGGYDRGSRYDGHSRYDHSRSRSSFSFAFGFGQSYYPSYRSVDVSYRRYAPVYYAPAVVYRPTYYTPTYYAPPVVYAAPSPYDYYDDSCYSRPSSYYYSEARYSYRR